MINLNSLYNYQYSISEINLEVLVEFVQPIRDQKKINQLKKILLAESPRNHLMFVLGINSGLRISDILKLKVKDVVDEDRKVRDFIEMREQKTGKYKKFPLGKNVKKAIILAIQDIESTPDMEMHIFRSRQGNGPITRNRAYQIINKAARSVGIEDRIGTHTMRKSFGFHAYKAGVDLSRLQYIFNHASPATTLRYIGITQDEVNDIILHLNL